MKTRIDITADGSREVYLERQGNWASVIEVVGRFPSGDRHAKIIDVPLVQLKAAVDALSDN